MKKYICAILTLFIVISLCSCSSGIPSYVLTPSDVDGKTVGVLSGTAAVRLFDDKMTVRVYSTKDEIISSLKAGSIDCILTDSSAAANLTRFTFGVKKLDEPYFSDGFRFIAAKENADLINDINTVLAQLYDDNVLKSIEEHYMLDRKYEYESPEDIERTATLTMAVDPDFAPFSFRNAEGELDGIDIAISRRVCDVLGLELEIVEVPMEEHIEKVSHGEVNFALGGHYYPTEGAIDVAYSNPYILSTQVVIIRK